MSPCSISEEEQARLSLRTNCRECRTARAGTGSIDLQLKDSEPIDKPMNFIAGTLLSLIYKPFLFQLDEQLISKHLAIGRVFAANGSEYTDWVTFCGHHRVIVRGTHNPSCRQCEACGRVFYSATGKHYLYPAPSSEVDLFESDLGGLVLKPETASKLSLLSWKRQLIIEELPVLDAPKDGLGELPAPVRKQGSVNLLG